MTSDPRRNSREETKPLEVALERQLSAIEQEQTPERLLSLAQELQRLLRSRTE